MMMTLIYDHSNHDYDQDSDCYSYDYDDDDDYDYEYVYDHRYHCCYDFAYDGYSCSNELHHGCHYDYELLL